MRTIDLKSQNQVLTYPGVRISWKYWKNEKKSKTELLNWQSNNTKMIDFAIRLMNFDIFWNFLKNLILV